MFKTIKNCPVCGSTQKTEIIKNNKNIYSYFLSKILNLKENIILKEMYNYKCKNCELIYKKKWIYPRFVKKIYKDYQPTHPGGLNTLKINFGKKKFLDLLKEYNYFQTNKNYELSDRKKREVIKILESTNNDKYDFIKFKKRFIQNLINNNSRYISQNQIKISKMIDKPKTHSQFSGFRSNEISKYLKKTINLRNLNSYAEIGCPLWGNYDYFNKPWIKQFFIDNDEENFWKSGNCLKFLSKRVKILKRKNKKQIDFVGIYNFLDHLENPLKLFHNELKNVKFLGIICDDIKLSKKIDCQHFSSWNYNSLKFLSKKVGFSIYAKPLRLSNTSFKLYMLKKR